MKDGAAMSWAGVVVVEDVRDGLGDGSAAAAGQHPCATFGTAHDSNAVCFYRRRLPAAREDKVEGVRVSGCLGARFQSVRVPLRVSGFQGV